MRKAKLEGTGLHGLDESYGGDLVGTDLLALVARYTGPDVGVFQGSIAPKAVVDIRIFRIELCVVLGVA